MRFKAIIMRLLHSLLVLFGVSILIFSIARVIPGDPARIALGPNATKEQVSELRDSLHLDEILLIQYGYFLVDLSQGDLGQSLYTNRPVMKDLSEFFPATLELVFYSAFFMIFLGVGLGIISARYQNSWIDSLIRLISLSGIVTPSFVWAIFLMLVFSYWLDWFPVFGRLSEGLSPPEKVTGFYTIDAIIAGDFQVFSDALHHIVLPSLALAMSSVSQTSRLVRANLVESYNKPYIEMARAYGFSEFIISTKYALRPAMIPALTVMGLDFAAKLGNAFLVEAVYGWPGMARYGVQTILYKDLNAIVGTVLLISAFFLIVNIVVDVCVGVLNPRIRLSRVS